MSAISKLAGFLLLAGILFGGRWVLCQAQGKNPLPTNDSTLILREFTPAEKSAIFAALEAKDDARNTLQQKLDALWVLTKQSPPHEDLMLAQLAVCQTAKADCENHIKAIDADLAQTVAPKTRARLYYLGVLENGLLRDPWTIPQKPKQSPTLKNQPKQTESRWYLPKGPGLD
jgi:hypothetical protein